MLPMPYLKFAHVRLVARVHMTIVTYSVKGVLVSPLSKSINWLTPGVLEHCQVITPIVSRSDDYGERRVQGCEAVNKSCTLIIYHDARRPLN